MVFSSSFSMFATRGIVNSIPVRQASPHPYSVLHLHVILENSSRQIHNIQYLTFCMSISLLHYVGVTLLPHQECACVQDLSCSVSCVLSMV